MSWNPGAERFKGYQADEIIGQHFSVFYPAEDLEARKPQRELEGAEETGRFEDEGWRLRKDGSRFWANVVITALRDAKGELIGFAKVTRDLTARREAEEQARRLAAETAAHRVAEEKRRDLEQLDAASPGIHGRARGTDRGGTNPYRGACSSRTTSWRPRWRGRRSSRSCYDRGAPGAPRPRPGRAGPAVDLRLVGRVHGRGRCRRGRQRAERAFPGVAGVVVATRADGNDELELVKATDIPPAMFDEWRRIPLGAAVPLADVVRRGESIVMQSPADWWERYPDLAPLLERTGHKAQLVVPLIAAGRCIGALGIAFREPRRFGVEEQEFAESVAGQCAVALERARLFGAERAARAEAETANMAKGEFLAAMSMSSEPRSTRSPDISSF